jgi:hypothetical protein
MSRSRGAHLCMRSKACSAWREESSFRRLRFAGGLANSAKRRSGAIKRISPASYHFRRRKAASRPGSGNIHFAATLQSTPIAVCISTDPSSRACKIVVVVARRRSPGVAQRMASKTASGRCSARVSSDPPGRDFGGEFELGQTGAAPALADRPPGVGALCRRPACDAQRPTPAAAGAAGPSGRYRCDAAGSTELVASRRTIRWRRPPWSRL